MAVLTHFFEKYILYVHVQHSAAKKNWLNFWYFHNFLTANIALHYTDSPSDQMAGR